MKARLAQALTPLFARDASQILLTCDLGFGVFENFRQRFPRQFLNMGISEPHAVAFAAGLALRGRQVWIYSMPSFLVLRCAEALRNLIFEPALPVRLIGVGAGLTYGKMGSTHHALEDLAVIKVLPHAEMLLPSGPQDVSGACEWAQTSAGPVYLRLSSARADGLAKFSPLRFENWADLRPLSSFDVVFGGRSELGGVEGARLIVGQFPWRSATWAELDQALRRELAPHSPLRIRTWEEHRVTGGLGHDFRVAFEERWPGRCHWEHFGLGDFSCAPRPLQAKTEMSLGMPDNDLK